MLRELSLMRKAQGASARTRIDQDRWYRVWLLALVILGAILRLLWLGLVEFRHDSAYWALDGLRIVRDGAWPLIGQQVGSVDVPFYNGPFLSYITAAVFAIAGPEPVVMSGLIALANAVAIAAAYYLGRRLYSPFVGIVTATLVTVAPWLVLYGRMYWPQALFPLLMALALLTLLRAVEEQRGVWYLGFGMLLGIGVQLHLSVLAFVGTGVLYILLYGRPRHMVSLYGLGVIVGYLPIVIYDLMHGFPNVQAIAVLPSLHATEEPRLTHIAKALWNFSNVLSGQGLWVSKLAKTPFLPAWQEWSQGILFSALFGLGAAMTVYTVWRASGGVWRRVRLSHQDALLVLFIGMPLLYLLLSRSLIQRHYFIFFVPLTQIMVARGIELWLQHSRSLARSLRFIPVVMLGIGLVLNLATATAIFASLHQSGGASEYGTVLGDKADAATAIIAASNGNFTIDLTGVRETLPFIFLFERAVPLTISGTEVTATAVQTRLPTAPLRTYRVIERPYAALIVDAAETIIFERRGIVVVEVRP